MFGELRPVDGGSSILLEKPSITVGQDRTCDVVIEHPSVSANHCLMEFREGHWFIEDLGSRGGIGVNGEKVESAWVPALSVINIGSIEFDLKYSSAQASTQDDRSVSPELLSKLDRAMKLVTAIKDRRIQVRADQPAPADLPLNPLGMLKPSAGGPAIPLLYDELYLGRDPAGDVVLPYMSVAKTHCVLRFQEGYWLVRDLNNNGVSINGEIIQEGWLLPGAVLGIATHQFEIAYVASASSAPPEMPVPINEFDVSDEDSSDDDSGSCAKCVVDEPLQAVDAMLASIEEMLPPIDDEPSPVAEPNVVEPQTPTNREASAPGPTVSGTALAAGVSRKNVESKSPVARSDFKTVAALARMRVDAEETRVLANAATSESVFETASSAIPLKVSAIEPVSPGSPTRAARTKGHTKTKPAAAKPPPSKSSPAKPLVVTKQQVSVTQLKHERIVQFLRDREFDGLLLSRPASIAWYTSGAEVPLDLSGQAATALLITPEGGTLLARMADHDLLLNHTTAPVAWQHRECAWPDPASGPLTEWLGTNKLACDQSFEPCADVACSSGPCGLSDSEGMRNQPTHKGSGYREVSSEVSALRLPLRPLEIENLRKLGIRVARTVERAAREFQRGDTEAQIAGDLASRLIRHEVHPVQIQVWGDGRGRGCQNWRYGRETVNHDCTISVVARRHGLHVAVSRSVSFGIPSKELRWTFQDMLLAHATALTHSQDQAELSSVWADVQRVCETLGEAEAWRATDPGCVTGYELCEAPISATSARRLQAGTPVIWRSLIGPARAVDTILVREADSKVITQTGEWPQVGVAVNNEQFFVQTVLQRSL